MKTYILRLVKSDMSSRNGFVWPTSGPVKCTDWEPTTECGNGLHGWEHGIGDYSTCGYFNQPNLWLVVEVDKANVIDLDGKVKFPSGAVLFTGTQFGATQFLIKIDPLAIGVIGATISTSSNGTATAGDYGTATAGDYGTATAGYYGTATAGYNGTATAGYNGTATAGYNGTATAGDYGTLIIKYWCTDAKRYKLKVGYIGEAGLEPNITYKLDTNNEFVKV